MSDYFTREELDAMPLLPVVDGKVILDPNNPEHVVWISDDDE